MKDNDVSSGASGWGAEPRRLTPLDIQEKQFGSARLRTGYLMHEVDEFLDEVTETLSALIAENERLRRGVPAPAARPSSPSAPAAIGDADRAAVEAFLRREKGFLQDLGSLVQGHAEDLKAMVRSARAGTAAATPPPEEPEVAEEASEPAETAVADPPPSESAAAEPAPHDEPSSVEAAPPPEEDASTDAVTGEVVEEPIRLEEPQPARRSRRADDESGGSLRELFWGEE
jgi:DivIVA domain-containing protein